MIHLPAQLDAELRSQFRSFDHACSTTIRQSVAMPAFSLHRCAIHGIADAVGFWTGLGDEYVSYLALRPSPYSSIAGFEAFRAWTDPGYRRSGLAAELLTCAVCECGQIISDREGMTPGAFDLWQKVSTTDGLDHCYLDTERGVRVDRSDIPEGDFFSGWGSSERWQMLLRPAT